MNYHQPEKKVAIGWVGVGGGQRKEIAAQENYRTESKIVHDFKVIYV